jgi:hypothetical protein
MQGN